MLDVTKELSEAQQAALFTLLTFLEPEERGVDWDEETPAEFDEVELARLCLLEAWPLDDWNRRIDNLGSEIERVAALLEEFRPEYAGD
jgi:hypothetical protein